MNLKDATRTENLNFWSQEWIKHGICSDFSSMFDYFSTALQLRKQLNPGDYIIFYYLKNYLVIFVIYITYFSVLGLIPGSRYTVQDVANIVEGRTGAYPEIVGQLHKRNKTLQIKEIRICYKRVMLSPQNCPKRF